MAITDINISEQLQTDAPSIKYTGNEGPQNPQQQQEIQVAQQIWEALDPEQQGQFQSFEQFFQSGIWKQILQQMQADQGQGPEQQGIGSLGPQPMGQMPNRMGAEDGGRIGYSGGGGGNYEAQVQQLMDQGLSRPMAEFLASSGISTELKAQGGRIGYNLGGIGALNPRMGYAMGGPREEISETTDMNMNWGDADTNVFTAKEKFFDENPLAAKKFMQLDAEHEQDVSEHEGAALFDQAMMMVEKGLARDLSHALQLLRGEMNQPMGAAQGGRIGIQSLRGRP